MRANERTGGTVVNERRKSEKSVTSRIYVGLVDFRFRGIYLFFRGIYLCAREINPQFFQKSIALETVVLVRCAIVVEYLLRLHLAFLLVSDSDNSFNPDLVLKKTKMSKKTPTSAMDPQTEH